MTIVGKTLVAMLVASLLSACGGDELWGSIEETHALKFEYARALRQDTGITIEYVLSLGDDVEWICKLAFARDDDRFVPGVRVEGAAFLESVAVERVADDDFPPIENGYLQLDSFDDVQGGLMSGEFRVLFVNGRSLAGVFTQRLQTIVADNAASAEEAEAVEAMSSGCAAAPTSPLWLLALGVVVVRRRQGANRTA